MRQHEKEPEKISNEVKPWPTIAIKIPEE